MKRTLVSLLTLLTLSGLSVFTSCQKETTGDGTQFSATMESRDGKTVLNGTALNWVSGDQVVIYGTAGCGLYQATPQTPATVATLDNVGGETGDGPFRAFYPSTLTTDGVSITLPAAQTYVENSINEFPMYAESATNQLAFKNLCGVLKLHLTKANTNISSISVTANAEICGDYTVSHVNGVPYLSYTGNGSKTVTMACAPAQAIDNGRDFYIALPAFDTLKSITLTTDDGRVCTKTVKSNVCIGVQRSTVTEITFGENDMEFILPEGALPGLFSVSATQQVRFSQGNLQYQASTDTWRFAEHQYDYVGWDNINISSTYSGWIDLFGWGTSGWNSGAVCYQPWSNSTSYSDYYPGGSPSASLTGAYAEADWGWHNAISNGGNAVHTWRTLSGSEWDYLLRIRTNANEKWATGTIDGTRGVILLPDSWTLPEGCTFNPGGIRRDDRPEIENWINNIYSLSQWAAMEAAGAVFLPAAGHRTNSSVTEIGWPHIIRYVNRYGYYATTTPYNVMCTQLVSFRSYSISVNHGNEINNNRDAGLSVRVVRNCN